MGNESQGTTNGRLVNDGYTSWQFATSDDKSLLAQQQNYAALAVEYIQNAGPFFRDGKSVTTEIQNYLTQLSQSVPMTATSAAAYFAAVTAGFWSNSVVDYLAGYNLVVGYKFQ